MAKHILLDEFHLSVYALRGLSDAEYDAIRKTLDDVHFRSRLKRAIRRVVRCFASLHKVRVAVSR